MRASIHTFAVLVCLAVISAAALAGEASDVADVPSQDLRAGGDAHMRYFLIGPKAGAAEPEGGYALLVVMPGGDGSAEFQPFVKRILKFALPDGYIVAQPVAVKWTPQQEIVWPTARLSVTGAGFTTEQFVEAVVKDVSARVKIDPKRVFTLSWSSSGPAAYAISLQKETSVTGALVAMSVFKPANLPPLAVAKGRPFYILHSPDDRVCPFPMAEVARDSLGEVGAVVKFTTYRGGHTWAYGDPYGDIRRGIEWLENPTDEPDKPLELAEPFLVDGFETGTNAPDGWHKGQRVARVEHIWDKSTAFEGKASLALTKAANRYFPITGWARAFDCDGKSPAIGVKAMVKAKNVTKAVIDVRFTDAHGRFLHKWAAYIGARYAGDPPANHDWKEYGGTVYIPQGTEKITIDLQIYGPGEVWFDNLEAAYAK